MSTLFYYLMHRNDSVTLLEIDEVSGAITKVASQCNSDLLPLGARQGADTLRKWWQRRAVPLSQGCISSILQYTDIPTTQGLLVRSLGLSLSDHYWIKPLESDLTWEEVSLFRNDFRDPIGNMQMSGDMTDAEHIFSPMLTPGSSLQGDLRKKWVIQDGKRWLIKANRGGNSQQSLNEVFAASIHRKQGFAPYTPYELCRLDTNIGGGFGCICPNFASEELEFVPAIDVIESRKKRGDVSTYEHFIQICVDHALDEDNVRSFLEYQILADYVLTNTDRHMNNFGILRDSKTLQFVSMAPIFDNGNSMFWDAPLRGKQEDLTNITVNSFRTKEKDLLAYVINRNCVNIDRLPTMEELAGLYAKDPAILYIDALKAGYQKKIDMLEMYQRR